MLGWLARWLATSGPRGRGEGAKRAKPARRSGILPSPEGRELNSPRLTLDMGDPIKTTQHLREGSSAKIPFRLHPDGYVIRYWLFYLSLVLAARACLRSDPRPRDSS